MTARLRVHHGDRDDIIPLRASQQMVNALQKVKRPEDPAAIFTRYPDLMHDSWTAAYGNSDVFRWMLETKRTAKGDEKVVPDENKSIVA